MRRHCCCLCSAGMLCLLTRAGQPVVCFAEMGDTSSYAALEQQQQQQRRPRSSTACRLYPWASLAGALSRARHMQASEPERGGAGRACLGPSWPACMHTHTCRASSSSSAWSTHRLAPRTSACNAGWWYHPLPIRPGWCCALAALCARVPTCCVPSRPIALPAFPAGDLPVEQLLAWCREAPLLLEVHDRSALPEQPEFPIEASDDRQAGGGAAEGAAQVRMHACMHGYPMGPAARHPCPPPAPPLPRPSCCCPPSACSPHPARPSPSSATPATPRHGSRAARRPLCLPTHRRRTTAMCAAWPACRCWTWRGATRAASGCSGCQRRHHAHRTAHFTAPRCVAKRRAEV